MMSFERREQIYKGISSIAKKVYDATPILEAAKTSYIVDEMTRVGCAAGNFGIVGGALNSLIATGLVLEPIKGYFKRVPVKPKVDAKPEYKHIELKPIIEEPMQLKKESIKQPASTPAQQDKTKTPIYRMGELSGRLSLLADSIKALSKEINDVALDIEIGVESNEASAAKLKQLQSILNSLA